MLSFLFRRSGSLRLPTRHKSVDIQRVKISRQLRRPAFLAIAGPLLTLAIARTSDYWLPSDFRKALDTLNEDFDKAKKEVERKSKKTNYGEHWQAEHEKAISSGSLPREQSDVVAKPSQNQPIFLTFPIWMRLKNMPPYRDSDPEWEEFVKLQMDDARMEALFRNIAESTMAKFRQRPDARGILQKIRYRGQIGVSLEILVPYRPPPVYEVPGLLITAKKVSCAWRTLPEPYGSKLQRITHPVVFFRAFWMGVRVFCKITWSQLRSMINERLNRKPDSSILDFVKTVPARSGSGTARQEIKTDDPSSSSNKDTVTDKFGTSQGLAIFPFNTKAVLQSQKSLLGAVSTESAIKQGVYAFQSTFMTLQLQAWREVPRGACMIEGWIDYLGEFGMVRSQVYAIYLPSKDIFLGEPFVERINIFPHAPAISRAIRQRRAENERKVSQQKESLSNDFMESDNDQNFQAPEHHDEDLGISKEPPEGGTSSEVSNPEGPPTDPNELGQKLKANSTSQGKSTSQKDAETNRPP